MLIRTGNTRRLSNFLLWQLAYSEIYFDKKLWPDFNKKDYSKIIKNLKIQKEITAIYNEKRTSKKSAYNTVYNTIIFLFYFKRFIFFITFLFILFLISSTNG